VLFPQIYKDGELTSRLAKLEVGTVLQISNPEPTLYLPLCTMHKSVVSDSPDIHDILLVAGGTGIAPFVQLLDLATSRAKRGAIFGAYTSVRISLLFSNHTEADILFRLQLDEYAALFPAMFRVLYTLTSTDAIAKSAGTWTGAVGRVNPAMVKWLTNWHVSWPDCVGHGVMDAIPPIPEDVLKAGSKYRRNIVLCGPQGLMDSVTAQLCACGVPADAIVALDT
jgi:ferredoxin-NADP reductase